VSRLRNGSNVARRLAALASLAALLTSSNPASAQGTGIRIGVLPAGPLDALTDVAGVRIGQVTKIEGAAGPLVPGTGPVRTGATVILPNADPWNVRVAAATYVLNGNGELTGAHWVDEAGFMEVPIVLTDTLDVGRADDGVVDWMIERYPQIGVRDDVPLPIVAECDDQALNDIVGRHITAADVAGALDGAVPGPFARGNVGAGTGMRAFGFKAGIGTASRRIEARLGGYTVGVLVNANTGSRSELRLDGVPVGRLLEHELLPLFPERGAFVARGRAAEGSIIVVLATDAPLDSHRLGELDKRAVLGLGRTGLTSHVSSGDLLIAFSTTEITPRDPAGSAAPAPAVADDEMDALFAAAAEATEAAVADALLSARTLSGAHGITFYALPPRRVRDLLHARR
jgi:D-aminopeptidase